MIANTFPEVRLVGIDISSEAVKIGNELFEFMKNLTNYKLLPKYKREDPNLVKIRQASTEKAEKLIGFKLKIQIEEGITLYYEWRKKHI